MSGQQDKFLVLFFQAVHSLELSLPRLHSLLKNTSHPAHIKIGFMGVIKSGDEWQVNSAIYPTGRTI